MHQIGKRFLKELGKVTKLHQIRKNEKISTFCDLSFTWNKTNFKSKKKKL